MCWTEIELTPDDDNVEAFGSFRLLISLVKASQKTILVSNRSAARSVTLS